MENKNNSNNLFVQLQMLENQLTALERSYGVTESARKGRASLPAQPAAAPETPAGTTATAQAPGPIEEMRQLLLRIKEESSATLCESVLKEKKVSDIKKEVDDARDHITALEHKMQEKEQSAAAERAAGPFSNGQVKANLPLTAQEDRAHNVLEGERQEFRAHYDALEKDFEATEKRLLEEIRDLRENDTKRELELEKMKTELELALERKQAAESKTSSLTIEMMEMNVYNKSAAAAIRDKDLEISDLKDALEKARAEALKNGHKH